MNTNKLINMILRRGLNLLLRKGLSKGMDAASQKRSGKPASPESQKQARQAMRHLRRMSKF
ncbi:hypothetical protein N6L24_03565 [Cognatishimia sp. SS12]|uniref:hypothetical protein n=1 Tax=Cognatishimia sp. SS12 TaxID=2979465 RepID=UPI00232C26AB|nr:hypothetical protein [Cognatishimia sp. SS12]MDC0737343.1 hypothetical protein [Cognatishimia sp. SS12]